MSRNARGLPGSDNPPLASDQPTAGVTGFGPGGIPEALRP